MGISVIIIGLAGGFVVAFGGILFGLNVESEPTPTAVMGLALMALGLLVVAGAR